MKWNTLDDLMHTFDSGQDLVGDVFRKFGDLFRIVFDFCQVFGEDFGSELFHFFGLESDGS